jgi:hypothetical protein
MYRLAPAGSDGNDRQYADAFLRRFARRWRGGRSFRSVSVFSILLLYCSLVNSPSRWESLMQKDELWQGSKTSQAF